MWGVGWVFMGSCDYWPPALLKNKPHWKLHSDLFSKLFARYKFVVVNAQIIFNLGRRRLWHLHLLTGCDWLSHSGYCFPDSSTWICFYKCVLIRVLQATDGIFWWNNCTELIKGTFYKLGVVVVNCSNKEWWSTLWWVGAILASKGTRKGHHSETLGRAVLRRGQHT